VPVPRPLSNQSAGGRGRLDRGWTAVGGWLSPLATRCPPGLVTRQPWVTARPVLRSDRRDSAPLLRPSFRHRLSG